MGLSDFIPRPVPVRAQVTFLICTTMCGDLAMFQNWLAQGADQA